MSGMLSRRAPIAGGPEGIRQILSRLGALRDFYGAQPAIRAAALEIAAPQSDNDNAGNAARLAEFVRARVVYVADPIHTEFAQTPDVLLLAIDCAGRAFGDCDDLVLLFACLCESLGIPAKICAVETPLATPGTPDHVISCACINGRWVDFDLCAKGQTQPTYSADRMTV